ncbi:MAG: peptidoglycan DD-metalloendopeptidase family protein [Alphaproteobacteria bacterium]|nr:peptidoglycan DD-metalloendopeptidase family protein [Alphaproteobacteria bacterium]
MIGLVWALYAGIVGEETASSPTPEAPTEETPPEETPPEETPGEQADEDLAEPDFAFRPTGELQAGSGTGQTDGTVWAPAMRFPLESAPAYLNSQVYGVGGSQGPSGNGQCDTRNYAYPWRDNFCETRSHNTLMCPAAVGHQGQDIRPATCKKAVHWAVAAEDGRITNIGTYTVFLTADSGRLFRYLHLDMGRLNVIVGQEVKRGDRIGLVSNDFGSTVTTIHLHFEIKEAIDTGEGQVFTFVSPYTSLVEAYERLRAGNP